jgi:hypothetical protein
MIIERSYILKHSMAYAECAEGLKEAEAFLYAVWYADNYPEGDISHVLAFGLWQQS